MSWAQYVPSGLMTFHLLVSSPIQGAKNQGKTLTGNFPSLRWRDLAAIAARSLLYGPD